MAFIVDFPIKHGDFPLQNVSSPEGKATKRHFNRSEDIQIFSSACEPTRNPGTFESPQGGLHGVVGMVWNFERWNFDWGSMVNLTINGDDTLQ